MNTLGSVMEMTAVKGIVPSPDLIQKPFDVGPPAPSRYVVARDTAKGIFQTWQIPLLVLVAVVTTVFLFIKKRKGGSKKVSLRGKF